MVESSCRSSRHKWVLIPLLLMCIAGVVCYLMATDEVVPNWASAIVPADAEMVCRIKIDNIRKSELYAGVSKTAQSNESVDINQLLVRLLSSAGLSSSIDLEKISDMLVVGSGITKGNPNISAAIRLESDIPLENLISGDSVKSERYGDRKYIKVESQRPIYITRIEKGLFGLFSNESYLKATIDRINGDSTEQIDGQISSLIKKVDANDLYMATIIDESVLPRIPIGVKGLTHAAFGIKLGDNISVAVHGQYSDPELVKTHKDQIDNIVSLGSAILDLQISNMETSPEPQSNDIGKIVSLMKMARKLTGQLKVEKAGTSLTVSLNVQTTDLLEAVELVADSYQELIKTLPTMVPGFKQ